MIFHHTDDDYGDWLYENWKDKKLDEMAKYNIYQRYPDGQPDSWVAVHPDYDGAPDEPFGAPADDRLFYGPTKADVISQIKEYVGL